MATATRRTSARPSPTSSSAGPAIETVHSDLTYDLRSGEPDALDQMVAITFANVAVDLLADGQFGRMVAIRDGKYAHAPLPGAIAGRSHARRRHDVQHRALPAPVRGQARLAAAAGAGRARVSDGRELWAPERRLLTVGLVALVTAAAFEGMAVPTVLPGTGRRARRTRPLRLGVQRLLADEHHRHHARRLGHRSTRSGRALVVGRRPVRGRHGRLRARQRRCRWSSSGARSRASAPVPSAPSSTRSIARAYPPSTTPRMIALISSAWVDSRARRSGARRPGDRHRSAGAGSSSASCRRCSSRRRAVYPSFARLGPARGPRTGAERRAAARSMRCAWRSARRSCWRR